MGTILRALTLLTLSCLAEAKQKDFYSFKVVNSRGRLVSLEKYRGSVSLVVNVASECGYTDEHYKDLQQLQKDFGPFHFNVLAFPCNQFGQQEPGSDKEIDSFVRRVYGVSFPIFSKIAVVGIGANNAYKYLVGEWNRPDDRELPANKNNMLCGCSHKNVISELFCLWKTLSFLMF
uniref:Glutathione peroxidase n=1 Tax=Cyprinus carpio TaxID=7962 RepID=A0A8C2HXF3_CYPCA